MLDTRNRNNIQSGIDKLAKLCIKLKLSANMITLIAFILGIISAAMLFVNPFLALAILWLSGLFDVVDGSVARLSKTSSKIGMMYDILSDRFVESLVIIIIAYLNPEAQFILLITLASFILCMSVFLISGSIIKLESEKSFYYTPSLTERTETFIYLSLIIIFTEHIFLISIIFILMVSYSIIDRMHKVRLYLKNEEV